MDDSSEQSTEEQHNTEKSSADTDLERKQYKEKAKSIDLDNHSIEQNIWILAGPLMAERLLQSLVQAADTAMVGRVGAASVAAVGLSNQISMVATSMFDAIRVGTTAVVARRIGANRIDEAENTLRQSLLVAAFIGISAYLVFSMFAGTGLSIMGAEEDVISQGIPYFRWKGLSLLFQFMTMTFTAALRGSGNTRLPMYVGFVVNLLNLSGNYLLIGGNFGFPALGAEGAGMATAFAHFCGMIMIILITSLGNNLLKNWSKGSFLPDRDILTSVLKIGLPASGERLILRGAQLLYTRAVAGLGTAAYAAHQIALRLESISLTIGFSFGTATTTLVGQYLGYGDPEKAEAAAHKSRKVAAMAMAAAGLLLFIAAPSVVKLFIPDDPTVIRMGSTVLRIIAVAQPFMGINRVYSGGLRGAGDTAWVMYITATSSWLVRVALTYLFIGAFNLHLAGAWYAMTLDLITRSILFQLRFKSGHWKEIKV